MSPVPIWDAVNVKVDPLAVALTEELAAVPELEFVPAVPVPSMVSARLERVLAAEVEWF